MSLDNEIADLRQQLERLIGEFDCDLVSRYSLRRPFRHEELSPYRRARMAIGRTLRRVGLRRTPTPPPWVPTLKPLDACDDATVVIIWGIGAEQEAIRRACTMIEQQRAGESTFVPVLITDVADFAFYSRLGWLVELVPTLPTPAGGYSERKLAYLAWRYRDAIALPLSAGLGSSTSISTSIARARETLASL